MCQYYVALHMAASPITAALCVGTFIDKELVVLQRQ